MWRRRGRRFAVLPLLLLPLLLTNVGVVDQAKPSGNSVGVAVDGVDECSSEASATTENHGEFQVFVRCIDEMSLQAVLWQSAGQTHLVDSRTALLVFRGEVSAAVCEALHGVAGLPGVVAVQRRTPMTTLSKFACGIIQSGKWEETPLWRRHIRGEGQIIAIGDTGLDYDMCFFYDPDYRQPTDSLQQDARKVIYYKKVTVAGARAKQGIDSAGHGTQMASCVAGELIPDDWASFDPGVAAMKGMAYRAKLAILDFGSSLGELKVPANLAETFYEPAHKTALARISLSSWGGTTASSYDVAAQQVDDFAFKHREHLLMFACGNEGRNAGVTSPALAKNVLAVGAVANAGARREAIELLSPEGIAGVYEVGLARFGASFASSTIEARAVLALPVDACADLTNKKELEGNIALVDRGSCVLDEKAFRAQEAGSIMVIVMNILGGGTFELDVQDQDRADTITILAVSVSKSLRTSLLEASAAEDEVVIKSPGWLSATERVQGSIASFSSRGPTRDFRIKPDIMAPGLDVTAGTSDQKLDSIQCSEDDLSTESGTSIAAAVAAGGAALVRQYFTEGWYPTGEKTAADVREPTSALLKAMLISSCTAATGEITMNGSPVRNIRPAPSMDQGFGKITLNTVLYFADDPNAPKLFVVERTVGLANSDAHRYCIRITGDTKLTLVWTDPPAKLNAFPALVNNLDLVAYVDGDPIPGNQFSYTDEIGVQHYEWDDVNNVEQITIKAGSGTKLNESVVSVQVRATNVPEKEQDYALVVSGEFDVLDSNACAGDQTCLNECSNQGTCQIGRCVCDPGFAGSDCSLTGRPLSLTGNEKWTQGNVKYGTWQLYTVEVTSAVLLQLRGGPLLLRMRRLSGNDDPDLFVGRDTAFPTLTRWSTKDNTCDLCLGDSQSRRISQVQISSDQLKEGEVVRFGVFGFCCFASIDFEIQATVPAETGVDEGSSAGKIVLIVSLAVLAVLAVAVLAKRCLPSLKDIMSPQSPGGLLIDTHRRPRPSAMSASEWSRDTTVAERSMHRPIRTESVDARVHRHSFRPHFE